MSGISDGSFPKRSVSPTSLSMKKPIKKLPPESSINRISTGISYSSDNLNNGSINRISTGAENSIFSRRSDDEMISTTNNASPDRLIDLPSLSKSIDIIQPYIFEENKTNSVIAPVDNINVSMDGITVLHSPSKNNNMWKSASSNVVKHSSQNVAQSIENISPHISGNSTDQLSIKFKLSELRDIFDKCLVIVNDLDDEFDYDHDYSGIDSKDQGNLADMQSLSRYILWKLSCKELSQDILAFHPTSTHGYMRWDDLVQLARPYLLDYDYDNIKYKSVRPMPVSPDKYIDLLDPRTIEGEIKASSCADVQNHFSYNPSKNDTNMISNESMVRSKSDHSLELAIEVVSSVRTLQSLIDDRIPVASGIIEHNPIPIPRINENIISTKEMFSYTTISNTNTIQKSEDPSSPGNTENNKNEYKSPEVKDGVTGIDIGNNELAEISKTNVAPIKPFRERNSKSNLPSIVNDSTLIDNQTSLPAELNSRLDNTFIVTDSKDNHFIFNGIGISLKLNNLARGIMTNTESLPKKSSSNSRINSKSNNGVTDTNSSIQSNNDLFHALKRLKEATSSSSELVSENTFQYTPLTVSDNISRWNILLTRREPLSFARSFDVTNCIKYKLGISANYIKVNNEKNGIKKHLLKKGGCSFYIPIPMPTDLITLNYEYSVSPVSVSTSEIYSSVIEMKTTKGIFKTRFFTLTYESTKSEFYFRVYSKYIISAWGVIGLSMKIEIPVRLISTVISDKDDTRCFGIRYYYDNNGDNYSTVLVPKSEDDTQQISLRATNSPEKNIWITWLENIMQYCKKNEMAVKNNQLQLEKQFKAKYELEKKLARINS